MKLALRSLLKDCFTFKITDKDILTIFEESLICCIIIIVYLIHIFFSFIYY